MTFGISGDPETERIIEDYPWVEEFMSNLHGSGIDFDWSAEETRDSINLYNGFHLMDEYGSYYAVSEFVVIIPKIPSARRTGFVEMGDVEKMVDGLKIRYTDFQSHHLGEEHGLKDLLYDGAHESLRTALTGIDPMRRYGLRG